MLIAFISDVHSNLPALEAVMDDMSDRGVRTVFCAGDILGYYTFPNETVDMLRAKNVNCIAGNHDRAVLVGVKNMNSIAAAAISWTRDVLSPSAYEYIRELPNSLHRPVEGVMTAVHHGSPRFVSEYVFEEHVSSELLDIAGAKLLVLGHTHMPYLVQFPSGTVVNPGSVGQPRDGDTRASYALLDTSEQNFHIVRVKYDVETVMKGITKNGLPEMLAQRLLRGS
ncbi:MAG: metallophosphoesterase family protein [Methanomassiliicoccales archaeon]|nr:metallophosphoesterase family protein [Methanomassiliicoccales archaeon]